MAEPPHRPDEPPAHDDARENTPLPADRIEPVPTLDEDHEPAPPTEPNTSVDEDRDADPATEPDATFDEDDRDEDLATVPGGPTTPTPGADNGAAHRHALIRLALAVLILAILVAVIWNFVSWIGDSPEPVAPAAPNAQTATVPSSTVPGQIAALRIWSTPPPIAGSTGNTVDFGTVDYRPDGAIATVDLILTTTDVERNDRVVFSLDSIDPGNTKPGRPPTTAPTIPGSATTCFDTPKSPDTARQFCTVRLEWRPVPGEHLAGTLLIRFAPPADAPGLAATDPTATAGPPWPAQVLRLQLTGESLRKPRLANVSLTPEHIDFGTVPSATPQRAQLTFTVRDAAVDVLEITIDDATALGLAINEPTTCKRRYTPGAVSNEDWCVLGVQWTPSPGQPSLDTLVRVTWTNVLTETEIGRGHAPDRTQAHTRINGTPLPTPQLPDVPALNASPPAISFRAPPSPGIPTTIRTTLATDHHPVLIERIELFAERPDHREGLAYNAADCTRADSAPAEINHQSFCTVDLTWTPIPGAPINATLIITYRANARRATLEIPVQGTAGQGRKSASDPARDAARARFRARTAQPSLRPGLGILELPAPGTAPQTGATAPPPGPGESGTTPGAPTWIEPDYSSIGLNPRTGLSTRPVPLTYTVLEGSFIHVATVHTADSKLPSPIVAVVQRDIYGTHGRFVVIPRGSKVLGRTAGPVGLNDAGSNSMEAIKQILTTRQGRFDIQWHRIIRPDGTAFDVRGILQTTDLMARAGVGGTINLRELERYLHLLSATAIKAAAILIAGANQSTTSTTVINDAGQPVTTTQIERTPKQQIADEFGEGINEIAAQMATLALPLPTIVLPTGTRMVLIPTADLRLRPATGHLAYNPPGRAGESKTTPPGKNEAPSEAPTQTTFTTRAPELPAAPGANDNALPQTRQFPATPPLPIELPGSAERDAFIDRFRPDSGAAPPDIAPAPAAPDARFENPVDAPAGDAPTHPGTLLETDPEQQTIPPWQRANP